VRIDEHENISAGADDLTALGVVVEDIQYVVGGSMDDTQVTQVSMCDNGW
jgi:hypothetical protein